MILGLDTATPSAAAAVLGADGAVTERRHDPAPGERPGHAARLLGLVEAAMAAAGVEWGEVDRIAAGVGPGGFTGLRIGLATARGLAQARGIELVGVGSLHALAHPLRASSTPVLAVLDARRGEAFAAAFAPGGAVLRAPAALGPDGLGELAAELGAGVRAVGDGAVAFRGVLERAGAIVAPDGDAVHRVTAAAVVRLGAAAPAPTADPLPDYAREPDAVARRAP